MKKRIWTSVVLALVCVVFSLQTTLGALAEATLWSQRRAALDRSREEKMTASPGTNARHPRSRRHPESPRLIRADVGTGPQSSLAQIPTPLTQGFLSSANAEFHPTRSVVVSHLAPRHPILTEIVQVIGRRPAVLSEIYDPPASQQAPVILVQDVHMNPEAQRYIAEILDELMATGRVGIVGVEGAFRDFRFERFRAFPDAEIRRNVADAFLEKNWISAPSYAGLLSAKTPPLFAGVDDEQLHQAHVQCYLDSRPHVARHKSEWEHQRRELNTVLMARLPQRLIAFDRLRNGFTAGTVSFGVYAETLHTWFDDIPSLAVQHYLEAHRLENSLDWNRVETERAVALRHLAGSLTPGEQEELLSNSVAARSGRLGPAAFHRWIMALCEAHGLSLKDLPHFQDYLRYVLLSESLQVNRILADLKQTEDRIEAEWATPAERKLLRENRHLALKGKLLDFALTPAEWEEYRLLAQNQTPNRELENFERFYQLADIRSHAMLANLNSHTVSGIKVLVVGGFHSPLITEHLRTNKTPYLLIAPSLRNAKHESGTAYLSVFAQEHAPLAHVFQGRSLFVNPPGPNIASQQRQSAPYRMGFLAAVAALHLATHQPLPPETETVGRYHAENETAQVFVREEEKIYRTHVHFPSTPPQDQSASIVADAQTLTFLDPSVVSARNPFPLLVETSMMKAANLAPLLGFFEPGRISHHTQSSFWNSFLFSVLLALAVMPLTTAITFGSDRLLPLQQKDDPLKMVTDLYITASQKRRGGFLPEAEFLLAEAHDSLNAILEGPDLPSKRKSRAHLFDVRVPYALGTVKKMLANEPVEFDMAGRILSVALNRLENQLDAIKDPKFNKTELQQFEARIRGSLSTCLLETGKTEEAYRILQEPEMGDIPLLRRSMATEKGARINFMLALHGMGKGWTAMKRAFHSDLTTMTFKSTHFPYDLPRATLVAATIAYEMGYFQIASNLISILNRASFDRNEHAWLKASLLFRQGWPEQALRLVSENSAFLGQVLKIRILHSLQNVQRVNELLDKLPRAGRLSQTLEVADLMIDLGLSDLAAQLITNRSSLVKYLSLNPNLLNLAKARLALARIYHARKQINAAVSLLTKIMPSGHYWMHPTIQEHNPSRFFAARLLGERLQFTEAMLLIADRFPGDPSRITIRKHLRRNEAAHEVLIELLEGSGDIEQALALAREAATKFPHHRSFSTFVAEKGRGTIFKGSDFYEIWMAPLWESPLFALTLFTATVNLLWLGFGTGLPLAVSLSWVEQMGVSFLIIGVGGLLLNLAYARLHGKRGADLRGTLLKFHGVAWGAMLIPAATFLLLHLTLGLPLSPALSNMSNSAQASSVLMAMFVVYMICHTLVHLRHNIGAESHERASLLSILGRQRHNPTNTLSHGAPKLDANQSDRKVLESLGRSVPAYKISKLIKIRQARPNGRFNSMGEMREAALQAGLSIEDWKKYYESKLTIKRALDYAPVSVFYVDSDSTEFSEPDKIALLSWLQTAAASKKSLTVLLPQPENAIIKPTLMMGNRQNDWGVLEDILNLSFIGVAGVAAIVDFLWSEETLSMLNKPSSHLQKKHNLLSNILKKRHPELGFQPDQTEWDVLLRLNLPIRHRAILRLLGEAEKQFGLRMTIRFAPLNEEPLRTFEDMGAQFNEAKRAFLKGDIQGFKSQISSYWDAHMELLRRTMLNAEKKILIPALEEMDSQALAFQYIREKRFKQESVVLPIQILGATKPAPISDALILSSWIRGQKVDQQLEAIQKAVLISFLIQLLVLNGHDLRTDPMWRQKTERLLASVPTEKLWDFSELLNFEPNKSPEADMPLMLDHLIFSWIEWLNLGASNIALEKYLQETSLKRETFLPLVYFYAHVAENLLDTGRPDQAKDVLIWASDRFSHSFDHVVLNTVFGKIFHKLGDTEDALHALRININELIPELRRLPLDERTRNDAQWEEYHTWHLLLSIAKDRESPRKNILSRLLAEFEESGDQSANAYQRLIQNVLMIDPTLAAPPSQPNASLTRDIRSLLAAFLFATGLLGVGLGFFASLLSTSPEVGALFAAPLLGAFVVTRRPSTTKNEPGNRGGMQVAEVEALAPPIQNWRVTDPFKPLHTPDEASGVAVFAWIGSDHVNLAQKLAMAHKKLVLVVDAEEGDVQRNVMLRARQKNGSLQILTQSKFNHITELIRQAHRSSDNTAGLFREESIQRYRFFVAADFTALPETFFDLEAVKLAPAERQRLKAMMGLYLLLDQRSLAVEMTHDLLRKWQAARFAQTQA